MKYLVLLAVLAIAIGVWRKQRGAHQDAKPAPKPPARPQDMVACERCGIHLPRAEALHQDGHFYCCAEHLPQHSR